MDLGKNKLLTSLRKQKRSANGFVNLNTIIIK